jgi:gliding motility-associated-like protein
MIGYSQFQFTSNSHALATKNKYTTRNFRSAIFNQVYYYNNIKLSIHQLNRYEYTNFLGVQSMWIMRDTASTLGGYTSIINVRGSSSNYAKDFETDANDNYIVLADNKGLGWNPTNPVFSDWRDSTQLVVCKVAPNSNVLWHKVYGGSSAEYAVAIRKTADNNYLVLSQTESNDGDVTGYNGAKDIWLMKISDIDGSIIWKKAIGTAVDEIPTDMEILQDGSIIISGMAQNSTIFPSTQAGYNCFLLKLDAAANIIWSNTFGGNGKDILEAFTPTVNNEFVSISTTNSSNGDFPTNNGSSDIYIMRHNSLGQIIWKKHYGLVNEDIGGDIAFGKCDSTIFVSFSKEFTGLTQPFNFYPNYCQNGGLRVALDFNGNETSFYEDFFPYLYSNSNEVFNDYITPSIAANDRGGVLALSIYHNKWNSGGTPPNDRGNTTRSFSMTEFGLPLVLRTFDTSICKGRPAWGSTIFNTDTTYNDTLRNRCLIDTAIYKYSVHIINADTSFTAKDSLVCYGSKFKNQIVTTPFIDYDTSNVNTICGPRLVIKKTQINITPKITNPFNKDTTLCKNGSIVLNAYTPALSYLWQDNSANQTYNVTNPGLYWVEVTDTFRCKSRDTVIVQLSDIILSIYPDTTIRLPNTVLLIPQTNGVVTWSNSSTLNCTTCQNALANPRVTTTYALSSTKNGCSANTVVRVNVLRNFYIYVPNAFTPNGDALNPTFKATTNISGPYLFEIFNRYGEKVFSTKSTTIGWDGTFKGEKQPLGNYVYVITYKENTTVPEQLIGNVLLLRD